MRPVGYYIVVAKNLTHSHNRKFYLFFPEAQTLSRKFYWMRWSLLRCSSASLKTWSRIRVLWTIDTFIKKFSNFILTLSNHIDMRSIRTLSTNNLASDMSYLLASMNWCNKLLLCETFEVWYSSEKLNKFLFMFLFCII